MDTRRVVLLLAVLVAVAYGPSLRNGFVFDDMIFMEHDPRVKSLAGIPRLFVEPLWAFVDKPGASGAHQYYRPLQPVPLVLSNVFFGGAAWPCQLLDVLLHFLNTLLVLVLLGGLLADAALAALGAALFAVHPSYSEAVLWVANVAGLGAAAATLGIVLVHLTDWGGRWSGRVLSATLFLVGLWFKETVVVAPALLVAHDVVFGRRRRGLVGDYLVFLPPFALYAAMRLHALGGWIPGLAEATLPRRELALNAVALVPEYLKTFLWPVDLDMYHDFDPIHGLASPAFWLGAVAIAAVVLGFLATRRRHPPVAFGLAWIAIAVAPQLLVRWPKLNVYAERYLYLAAVGIFLALAYAVRHVPRRRLAAAVVPLLALAAVADARRAGDWRDEVTLFTKTIAQSPRAELIRNNLAVRYLELGRWDEGIAVAQDLLRISPDFPKAEYNLALLELGKGDTPAAMDALERAHGADPRDAEVLLNLGYVYDRLGRRDDAVGAYLRSVDADPASVGAWYDLGSIAFEQEQFGNARQAVGRVLRLAPDDVKARALETRLAGRAARRRPPGTPDPPATVRRCEAAKTLAEAGRYADAGILLRTAAWLDEASPTPHHYLANVHFLTGRLVLAAQEQRQALERAPANRLYERNLASLRRAMAARARAAIQQR